MAKDITLTIDNRIITVPAGTFIVDAAKKAGVNIPIFCYHPKLKPAGMCRLCLVEIGRPMVDPKTRQPVFEADGKTPKIQFGPKLDTSCTTPVSEGMVVRTTTDKVKAARKEVLEFILTSHPLDCPVCDKGGECPLQNLTMTYGPGESRFLFDEKMHLDKQVPLGELIYLDRERCIQCGRCVRYQNEIVGDPVIAFHNRGRALEIITSSEPGFDSIFSGNTTDICPVGALTTADFRFGARPWETTPMASVCSHCPVGCNITFSVRREARSGGFPTIKRVMPRQNELVNELWICDKGRFGYHYTKSGKRLTQPLIRKDGKLEAATWDEALERVAVNLRATDSELVTIVGGRLANEDLFHLRRLTQSLDSRAVLYTQMGGGDLVAQVGVGQGTNFGNLGAGSAIMVIACDLHEETPLWWLRVKQAAERGATVIVANPRPTRLDKYARHVVRYDYGDEVKTVLSLLPPVGPEGDLASMLESKLPEMMMPEAAKAFARAENGIILFGSEGIGLQASTALARVCAHLLVQTNHVGRANNGLIGVWQSGNMQGAWDLGFRPVQDLAAVIGEAKSAYIAAADPVGDDPSLAEALKSLKFVLVQDLFLTETAQLADVVLPAVPYTEREGTFTTADRRVQHFSPALPGRPGARADFAITGQIAQRLGFNLECKSAACIFQSIIKKTPGYAALSYAELSKVEQQFPLVGRNDLYYGGTVYENRQGLGIQLIPEAQSDGKITLPAMASEVWEDLVVPEGALLVVPITVLYDHGTTLLPSALLRQRLVKTALRMCPETAARYGFGSTIQLTQKGKEVTLEIQLDESVPAGVALLPRSAGVPVTEPFILQIR